MYVISLYGNWATTGLHHCPENSLDDIVQIILPLSVQLTIAICKKNGSERIISAVIYS